jgi:hypothetical protein
MVAAPLSQLAKSKGSSMRFQAVDKLERQKLGQHGQEVQRFRDERQKLETKAAATSREKPSKEFEPAKVRFPNSPIAAKSAREAGQDQTLPKTHEAPKPDLRVEARPRATRSPERPREYSVNRQPLDTKQPPATGPQQPQVDQPTRQAQPQPKAEQPTRQAQPQPKAERSTRQAQPQPKAERPTRQAQPQPKAERPTRQAQPQPKAERSNPPPRSASPSPGAKQDRPKGKGKN